MKKRFKALIFTLIFFTGLSSYSQGFVIHGKVLDATTQKPITEVEIINDLKKGVTTNSQGQFSISIGEEKKGNLKLNHIGYISKSIPYKELINRKDFVFYLEQKIEELKEFNVFGDQEKNQAYRVEQINKEQIEASRASGIGSLLRQEPNVSGVRKGAIGIDPVVRGLKYSQLNVQINNGIKIEGGCPNRMDPATAHVDMNDLQGITILKGPFGLKYGPNFGGIVNLETQQPSYYTKYETHVAAVMGAQSNHSGYKTKLKVNGGGQKVAYDLSGNWKKYGDYTAGNGELVNASFNQYNLAGHLAFQPASGHNIQLGVDRSWGRNIDFPALPMDERSDDTYIYSVDYFGKQISKTVNFIRAKIYSSQVHHIMDNKNRPFSDTVVAVSDINAMNNGGRFGINLNLLGGRFETGGEYEQTTKDGERTKNLIMQAGLPVLTEDLWNGAEINNLGVFAEFQKQSNRINWIVAARLDYNTASSNPLIRQKKNGDIVYENNDTESQYTNFSLSAGLSWNINSSNALTFSLGSGTRSPDMTERFIILLPIGYDRYDYLGNPQLKPETNNELDIGYRLSKAKLGQFQLSGFFSYITDYIYGEEVPPSVVKPQTPGVLGVKTFVNIDRAYLTGFELSYATPDQFHWQLFLNAAYTMGLNPTVDPTDPLAEIPPFETDIKFTYRLFNNRFVPELDLRIVAAQNKVSTEYNEMSTPAFTTLDFKLTYQFNQNLKVFAGVSNIFDTNYYEHLNRNMIGSNQPLHEPGRIFFLDLIFKL